jgi:quercetin dioxygenase-like cupin family protein
MQGFHLHTLKQGLMFDREVGRYPTRVFGWQPASGWLSTGGPSSTVFGFVLDGDSTVHGGGNQYTLRSGQYFCFNDLVSVAGGSGFIVERLGYRGLDLVGGPVESVGRLKYIDGCTDTLLVPPVRRGDACFNALFFPSGINQTLHTHPSIRVGLVASGQGWCRTYEETTALLPGKAFVIDEESIHGFITEPGQSMVIIAYHPDSDFGPVDEDHPMINRTIVGGVSASALEEIRTQ